MPRAPRPGRAGAATGAAAAGPRRSPARWPASGSPPARSPPAVWTRDDSAIRNTRSFRWLLAACGLRGWPWEPHRRACLHHIDVTKTWVESADLTQQCARLGRARELAIEIPRGRQDASSGRDVDGAQRAALILAAGIRRWRWRWCWHRLGLDPSDARARRGRRAGLGLAGGGHL